LSDQYRKAYGVESICRVMQGAPSGYWRYAARQRNPALRCVRAQRDNVLSVDVERVWQANLGGI
jgi:putative transposase